MIFKVVMDDRKGKVRLYSPGPWIRIAQCDLETTNHGPSGQADHRLEVCSLLLWLM
jgi:hypothetical protein